jgi:hypothetical protein
MGKEENTRVIAILFVIWRILHTWRYGTISALTAGE